MDLMVKKFAMECIHANKPHYNNQLLYEHKAIFIKGVKQVQVDQNNIYDVLQEDGILNSWKDHHDFKMILLERVIQDAIVTAIKNHQKTYANLLGHIDTNRMLYHCNNFLTAACLLCNKKKERLSHVLRCQNGSSVKKFTLNI